MLQPFKSFFFLKGFVYYEYDCFMEVINPYIPIDDDNDNCYKKSHSQKPLIGEKRIPRAVANERFMIVAGMVSKKK